MAKSKSSKDGQAITPDLPDVLKLVKNQADENSVPIPSAEESASLAKLLELITPLVVSVPVKGSVDKTVRNLREPLLMISWDRGCGAWKWAVNDRVLKYTIYGHLHSLVGLAEGIEACLVSGKFAAKSTETT